MNKELILTSVRCVTLFVVFDVKSGHVTFEWQITMDQAITMILSLVCWTESGKQHIK